MDTFVDDKVMTAGRWISEQLETPAHVVSVIKEKFGLSALQACQACKVASDMRLGMTGRTAP